MYTCAECINYTLCIELNIVFEIAPYVSGYRDHKPSMKLHLCSKSYKLEPKCVSMQYQSYINTILQKIDSLRTKHGLRAGLCDDLSQSKKNRHVGEGFTVVRAELLST